MRFSVLGFRSDIRIELANLQTHKTHELLYGKETATDLEKEALFLKVQDFIIHSKRFD